MLGKRLKDTKSEGSWVERYVCVTCITALGVGMCNMDRAGRVEEVVYLCVTEAVTLTCFFIRAIGPCSNTLVILACDQVT